MLQTVLTKILKLLFFSLIAVIFWGCASEDKVADTPEALFKLAQEYEQSDRNQIAIQRYSEVKNRFPYSNLATEAELAIADVYYKTEDFAEAQVSYQNFKEFHPKHPRIDYVIYQIAMSYYSQLPDTIDRDLSLANDAIYNFNELTKKYPTSKYIKEAEENRKKAYVMLNEKELYIADFYFKSQIFDSALNRYEMSYKKFNGFGLEARALAGAYLSARELKDSEKEKKYSDILFKKFADTDEAKAARNGERVQ